MANDLHLFPAQSLSVVQLFATTWTVAHQASLFIGFSRQEYWSGLPFPSPGDLPHPGIEPGSPALKADSFWPNAECIPACSFRFQPSIWNGFPHLVYLVNSYKYISEHKLHVILSRINHSFISIPILCSQLQHSLYYMRTIYESFPSFPQLY